jgi:hypothetical protein
MTESGAAALPMVEVPRLSLASLRELRGLVDAQGVSSLPSSRTTRPAGGDDGTVCTMATTRSARACYDRASAAATRSDAGSNSSSSMIGARRRSRPTRPATCSKSSRIATTPARSLSPVKCPSTAGMRSSAILRLPMPSSTASFTMLTGSSSLARACANGVCSNHPLDPASKGKHHPNDPQRSAAGWPTSERNPGRIHIGMHGRLRRNPTGRERLVAGGAIIDILDSRPSTESG